MTYVNDHYCAGCGVHIQTENEKEPGYVPASALERETIVCRRCFRLKNYNEVTPTSIGEKEFLAIANDLASRKALIVKIVDVFDFHGSWISGIKRFAGNNDILLVANKADLLPKSVKKIKVEQWMRTQAKEWGVPLCDVALISADTGNGLEEVAGKIDRYATGKDVYVVGCTNVGKSTFINQLIRAFGAEDEATLTTSAHPGTTLGLVDIPLDHDRTMFDTPGLINHHQMAHVISQKAYKKVFPKKEIKPKIYQLNEGQTLFFAGLARLDIAGGEADVICYFSNELYIHRTKTDNASELYEKQLGDLLQPPFKADLSAFPALQETSFGMIDNKMDIVYSGLGWVTILPKSSVQVHAHAPKNVGVFKREALI
ncbi:ribosome biogenesis GTPase YqeH [Bacillaceae bacterium SIJ1]|uniref:ribosome biogenesis GTPase YqeH n=1 Tax=Litoribacterium kuwaitense TaxID=1398745 RepID=UPI0013EB2629|nr:ribosome biogenesis GTPase YqeH [Litoribacterium kuwaitense]NGP43483.1 ribosome biogenesis GTPase YqeH [Litoribacterium kuwaitense]